MLRWLLLPRRGLLAVDGVRLGVFTEIRDPTSETSLSAVVKIISVAQVPVEMITEAGSRRNRRMERWVRVCQG